MNVTYGPVFGMEYPMIVFCGRQEVKKTVTPRAPGIASSRW